MYDEERGGSLLELVHRDFAYEETAKDFDEYAKIRKSLIRWVRHHRWLPELDSTEIGKMYEEYIDEILFSIAVPIERRINAVKRKFSLLSES